MKTITIPQSVFLDDQNGNPLVDQTGSPVEVTFKNFVGSTILVDAKFGKTMEDVLSAVEIKTKLAMEKPTLELEDKDWERLLAVTSEPTNGYNTVVVVQLVSFFKAIKDAK